MARRGIGQLSVVAAIVAMVIPCLVFLVVVVGKETKFDRMCERFSNAHPRISEALGSPVELVSAVTEESLHNPKVGFYSKLALELAGPRGRAGLSVVLRRGPGASDRWRVAEASLLHPGAEPQPLDLSQVAEDLLWDPEVVDGE